MCVLSVCFEKHWKDILWQSFKCYETWKQNIVNQYYHEQVFSEVDKAKKLSDTELNIKWRSGSVGERIFRDLRSEINIPSEEKATADRKNGRLLQSKGILLILIFLNTF